jgi:uncharacterized membrane protein YfcA
VSWLEAAAILAAGIAAGTINTVVGSGTLITFPLLLAFGYSPVTANVSNTIGLFPGSFSGAHGYRHELAGQRRRVLLLSIASIGGGLVGAVLLLVLPASAFKAIVPGFIGAALLLVVVQPFLNRSLSERRRRPLSMHGALPVGLFVAGIYGGYFGAAQGILFLALLGLAIDDGLQRLNALKNILIGGTNLIAALVFAVAAAHVSWGVAGLLAAGSIAGGQMGARVGRRLPPLALRIVIVVVGVVAIVKLVV